MAVMSETQAQRLSHTCNLSAAEIMRVAELVAACVWVTAAELKVAADRQSDIIVRLAICWPKWSMRGRLALEADLRRLGLNPKLVAANLDAIWLRLVPTTQR